MGRLTKQVNWASDVLQLKTVVFGAPGTATEAAEPFTYVMPEDGNFQTCVVYANTAGITGNQVYDVHKNGTTLYTTQTSRPIAATTVNVTTEAAVADIQTLAKDDVITFHCDTISTGTAQADLTYHFTYLAKAA